MSDAAREQDPSLGGAAVDQGARSQQSADDDIRVTSSDEVIETLRRQLEERENRDAERDRELAEAKARASAAERARVDAENRAVASDEARLSERDSVARSNAEVRLDAVKNSLTMHEGQLTALATTKAGLIAEGKLDEAAQLDVQMAKIGGRIAQLEDGKAELEERIKATPAEQQQAREQPQQRPQQDPREAFIRERSPIVQQWLRGPNGDRFFSDPAFQRRVNAAASYAEEVRGLSSDSQAYIDFVEEEVGLRQRQQQQQQQRTSAGETMPRRQGRDADVGDRRLITAPAGGAAGGSVRSNPNGSTDVHLTQQEREIADMQGMSHAEYARAKRDLLREGLIGPNARRE